MSVLAPSAIALDNNGNIFPNTHIGGTNSRKDAGLGVVATPGANTILHLRFSIPPTLPTGTAKLLCTALANATTNAAKINPAWASVAAEENPDTITLNAEGTTTVTWASGDADVYKEVKINLDADTIVAGETVVMEVTFETTGFTLAVESTWRFAIIWE